MPPPSQPPPPPPAPPPAPTALTLEEFVLQLIGLVEAERDAYRARCCTPAERAAYPWIRPRSSDERAAGVAMLVPPTEALVQAGARRFDGVQAAACIAEFRRSVAPALTTCIGPDPSRYREDPLRSIPSCRDVIAGTAAAGARCQMNDDCGPTTFCARARPGDEADHCAPRFERGAACQAGRNPCALGDECVRGHCVAPLELGASCEISEDCARPARCSDAHLCVRPEFAADGAACTINTDCLSERCVRGRCQPLCTGSPAPPPASTPTEAAPPVTPANGSGPPAPDSDRVEPPPPRISLTTMRLPPGAHDYDAFVDDHGHTMAQVRFVMPAAQLPMLARQLPCRLGPIVAGPPSNVDVGSNDRPWWTPGAVTSHRRCDRRQGIRATHVAVDLGTPGSAAVYVLITIE